MDDAKHDALMARLGAFVAKASVPITDDNKRSLESSGAFLAKYSDACEARIAAFRPMLGYETVLVMWPSGNEGWRRGTSEKRAAIAEKFCASG
jgi:hypothetical protein